MMRKNRNKEMPSWASVKAKIQRDEIINSFHEGEVWWAAVGENIGVEINGKNERYSRPVVIVKKFSRDGFLGVPLTSVEHVGSWFAEIEFQGNKEYAYLSQVKTMSVKRLYTKMGTLPESDLGIIKNRLVELITYSEQKNGPQS